MAGDTVNLASRLVSYAAGGQIPITESTARRRTPVDKKFPPFANQRRFFAAGL